MTPFGRMPLSAAWGPTPVKREEEGQRGGDVTGQAREVTMVHTPEVMADVGGFGMYFGSLTPGFVDEGDAP